MARRRAPKKIIPTVPLARDEQWAVTPGRAGEALGCSRALVEQMIEDQTLTAVRYGRRIFVSTDSIRAFLAPQRKAA